MPLPDFRPVLVKAVTQKNTTKGLITKGTNFTVESEVLVPQADGTNRPMFFTDYQNNRAELHIPKGGLKLDKANAVDAHNLALLKVKMKHYPHVGERLVILDDEVMATESVRQTESVDYARAAIRALKRDSGIFAVRDFVAIVRGAVPPMTNDQLTEMALGLAEQDPDGTLLTLESESFEKARKLTRLVQSGEVKVTASGAVYTKGGDVLGESISAAMSSIGGVQEPEKQEPVIVNDQQSSDESHMQHILSQHGVANDPMKIEQDEIERVVSAAIETGYLEKNPGNGKYKLEGSDKFNMAPSSIMDHYINNPAQAATLKKNLVERGIITNVA